MPTTLSGRLYLGFGIIILMLCGTAAYSIITVMRLSDITEKLFRHPMAVNEALLTLDGSQSSLQPALLGLLEAKSDAEMASALLLIESLDRTSEDSISLLQERFLGPKEYLNNLKAILNEIKSLRSEIITLKANGQIGEASLPMQKRAEKLRTAATLFNDLKGFVKAKAVEFNDQASRQANTSIRIIVIVNLLAIAASTGIAMLMITSIRRPLVAAVVSTRAIADGHLNRRIIIASNDEVGDLLAALSGMQDKLREVVAQIYSGVERVTFTSKQLTDASRHVAQNNNEQISATESISATIEELSVSIAQMVDNTRETRRMLAQAGESSTRGSDVIYEALNEFNRVSSVIGDSSRLINDLDRQSSEISGIVSVIKNIAEQTNLLALNAAIESARAGEAGRGFAVVADEVRTLAARTTQSTQQVSAMIERIQESTKKAVGSMNNAVTLVDISSSKAQLAGESIGQIKQDSQKTIQVIDEIASSLAEQQAASENIAQHIEQIVQKSQQNTQPILETGSVAKNLLQLAGSLQATVAWFKT